MAELQALFDVLRPYASIIGLLSAILGFTSLLVGLVAKHIAERRQRAYDAQLAFVREQLRGLYGPLFLLSEAGDRAWKEFRRDFRPGRPMNDKDNPLTPAERHEYVRWLDTVFVPSNDKMRTIIEGNAHLFLEGKAPAVVLDLLAHFDELNVVLSKLRETNDASVFPTTMYPLAFGTYIRADYEKIVERHSRLTSGKTAALSRG